MTHRTFRIAAGAFTLFAMAHPAAAQAAPAAAIPAPLAQFSHISIETFGRGSDVIFIPGLSMSRESWRPAANRIAANHRVHLVQINGFGGSEPRANLAPGVLDGAVADLHAYVARESIRGAAIVGHSMGGLIELMWAKAYPGDMTKMMIVDSLPFVALIMAPPTVSVAQIEPQARAMRDQTAARYGKPIDAERHKAGIAMLALKPDSREKAAAWSIDADPRVSAETLYEDFTTDLRAAMPGIRPPITLVYPYAASGPPREAAEALYHGAYAKTPNITYVGIGDSAHFVMLDQPEAFARALAAFLAS